MKLGSPSSPSMWSFTLLPTDNDAMYFQHPNSPSIPHLPSINDEDMKLGSPSSPSMRPFMLLPSDNDAMYFQHPNSPSIPHLPSINDEDIETRLSLFPFNAAIHASTH